MQNANNVIAPAAFARPSIPPLAGQPALMRDREYQFCVVASKLGLLGYAPRTIVDTIRALVDNNGFPPPKTIRLLRGRRVTGGQSVTRRSCWNAADVEAWLDRDLPPAAALTREQSAFDHSRATMAGREHLLVAANAR